MVFYSNRTKNQEGILILKSERNRLQTEWNKFKELGKSTKYALKEKFQKKITILNIYAQNIKHQNS